MGPSFRRTGFIIGSFPSRKLEAWNDQLSPISHKLSAISHQPSAIGHYSSHRRRGARRVAAQEGF
jgi:hypothetical protein